MSLLPDLVTAVGREHVDELDTGNYRVTPGSAAEVAEVIRRAGVHDAAVHPVGSGGRPQRGAQDGASQRTLAGGAQDGASQRTLESGAQDGASQRTLESGAQDGASQRTLESGAERMRVFLSTKRLDQVLELDETSLMIHVQAGLTGLELERILAPRGLTIGDYPPVVLTSSLGGIIAVRTPGKSSARHGFFEDAVVGVSAVLADGRSVHTRVAPRRSTGPDLARALMGSEGTIGFITSAVLQIHTKPEARLVAAYTLPSVDAAVSAVYLALREEAAPSGLRIYDATEAKAHFDGLVLPPQHALLCAGTAGPTDLAACDRDLITSAVLAEGGQPTEQALAELWWRRLHAGEPTPGDAPNLQVMATPSKLRPVYRAVVTELATQGGSASAHISRFDADGAVAFFSLVHGDGRPDPSIVAAAERAAEAAGGWLLGARAAKLDPYLRALRDAIDPQRIMNPGTLA